MHVIYKTRSLGYFPISANTIAGGKRSY